MENLPIATKDKSKDVENFINRMVLVKRKPFQAAEANSRSILDMNNQPVRLDARHIFFAELTGGRYVVFFYTSLN